MVGILYYTVIGSAFVALFGAFVMAFGNKFYEKKLKYLLGFIFYSQIALYLAFKRVGFVYYYDMFSFLIGAVLAVSIYFEIGSNLLPGIITGGILATGMYGIIGRYIYVFLGWWPQAFVLIFCVIGGVIAHFCFEKEIERIVSTSVFGSHMLVVGVDHIFVIFSGYYMPVWVFYVIAWLLAILGYFLQTSLKSKVEPLLN